MHTMRILKDPAYFLFFLGCTTLLLTANAYFIFFLPGSNGYACIPGENITTKNILFGVFLSLSTAFLLTALVFIMQMPKTCSIRTQGKLASITGVSTISGIFTVFCTVCTLPIFSILGVSVGFSIFTIYNGWFKIISIIFSIIGIIFANQYLKRNE